MTDRTRDEAEALLRSYFAEHDRVSPLTVDSAKALFDLRRIDEELVELTQDSLAMRGDVQDHVLRFEHGDVLLVVRRRSGDVELLVSPPTTPVALETATGTSPIATGDDGVATLSVTGPARFRIELPDGRTGVTDGIDLTPLS